VQQDAPVSAATAFLGPPRTAQPEADHLRIAASGRPRPPATTQERRGKSRASQRKSRPALACTAQHRPSPGPDRQLGPRPGLAKTWSEIVDDCEARLHYYRDQLEHDPVAAHASEYLQRSPGKPAVGAGADAIREQHALIVTLTR
jgi:hypothetical protein